jgi:hypothetical protein
MATLTFTLQGSAIVNGSKVYTITDADIQKWINTSIDRYSPRDAQGVITTPLTPTEALLAWSQNQWINATVSEVQNYMTNQQMKTINVPPIVFVP